MTRDWARYWRATDRPLEAMHAHFERHVYHRHSHDTYSFGVTEDGAQSFTCRGAAHTSAAGMVMAFNPDDPHDGWAADTLGFTYRMVHIGPALMSAVLTGVAERPTGLPLFTEPVVGDTALARSVRRLHAALLGGAPALRSDELLTRMVVAAARSGAGPARSVRPMPAREARHLAERVRSVLDTDQHGDVTAEDLAAAVGRSRFAVYRAFATTFGMAPSDYQRQLRLRAARALLAQGEAIAGVAAQVGFTDQSHLSRWFTRHFGITPAAYRRAAHPGP